MTLTLYYHSIPVFLYIVKPCLREANFYHESSQYQHDRAYSICYTFTMKKKLPHEVTLHRISEMIEDLAVSTAKGFARNDERFDNLEKDMQN